VGKAEFDGSEKRSRHDEDDNVVRFDFRDELKKQRGKRRRKEWMLGLGAFSIVFAGGMLALNWPICPLGSILVYFLGAHTEASR
jgi:micrococcal nuclease